MIYLIGGPPRMGKSTMAQKLLKEHRLPYVSTDGLTVMLKSVGQPSFYSPEKSNKFYPYLDLFISRILNVGPDYVIEGDSFSPSHVVELRKKYKIKCAFLTMSEINKENIVKHAQHDKWVERVSEAHLNDLVTRITTASKELQKQCNEYGIECFDLSKNYDDEFEAAYKALMAG